MGGDRLENSYTADKEQKLAPQRQQQEQSRTHQREEMSPAMTQAAMLMQSGAKLQDLSPEQAREVAAVIGNQAVLQLLHGGSPIRLAPAPPGRGTVEALPETEADVRWPALAVLPNLIRDGPLPGGVFPADRLRPMGAYGARGVPPDG